MRRPVVASTAPALRELGGDAVVAVDPLDPDAIAHGLEEAIARRDDLRARGLERAGGYTWQRTAEQTAAIYRAVAEQRDGRSSSSTPTSSAGTAPGTRPTLRHCSASSPACEGPAYRRRDPVAGARTRGRRAARPAGAEPDRASRGRLAAPAATASPGARSRALRASGLVPMPGCRDRARPVLRACARADAPPRRADLPPRGAYRRRACGAGTHALRPHSPGSHLRVRASETKIVVIPHGVDPIFTPALQGAAATRSPSASSRRARTRSSRPRPLAPGLPLVVAGPVRDTVLAAELARGGARSRAT